MFLPNADLQILKDSVSAYKLKDTHHVLFTCLVARECCGLPCSDEMERCPDSALSSRQEDSGYWTRKFELRHEETFITGNVIIHILQVASTACRLYNRPFQYLKLHTNNAHYECGIYKGSQFGTTPS